MESERIGAQMFVIPRLQEQEYPCLHWSPIEGEYVFFLVVQNGRQVSPHVSSLRN